MAFFMGSRILLVILVQPLDLACFYIVYSAGDLLLSEQRILFRGKGSADLLAGAEDIQIAGRTRGVFKRDTAYSMKPSWWASITFQAMRMVKSSPRPQEKMTSGMTRESAQVMTTARGDCPAVRARRFSGEMSPTKAPLFTYAAFPSLSVCKTISDVYTAASLSLTTCLYATPFYPACKGSGRTSRAKKGIKKHPEKASHQCPMQAELGIGDGRPWAPKCGRTCAIVGTRPRRGQGSGKAILPDIHFFLLVSLKCASAAGCTLPLTHPMMHGAYGRSAPSSAALPVIS